jgi:hypothetical protein
VSQLLKVKGLAGVNQPCHGNTSGVVKHNFGLSVIASPRVVVIYWDQYFTSTPEAVTTMNQFITDLVTGTYMDNLSEYGVGRGSLQGHVVINVTTFPTPNSQHPGDPFSELQMQTQLIEWLDRGVVTPAPAPRNEASLVYLIVAPSDTTLSLGGNTGGFCGYHSHGRHASVSGENLYWATVQGYSKSPSGQTFVDSISYCVSHELVETFTNRDGTGWFSDDGNGCEIGDLCEADASGNVTTVPFGRWQVEKYWSNRQGGCTI